MADDRLQKHPQVSSEVLLQMIEEGLRPRGFVVTCGSGQTDLNARLALCLSASLAQRGTTPHGVLLVTTQENPPPDGNAAPPFLREVACEGPSEITALGGGGTLWHHPLGFSFLDAPAFSSWGLSPEEFWELLAPLTESYDAVIFAADAYSNCKGAPGIHALREAAIVLGVSRTAMPYFIYRWLSAVILGEKTEYSPYLDPARVGVVILQKKLYRPYRGAWYASEGKKKVTRPILATFEEGTIPARPTPEALQALLSGTTPEALEDYRPAMDILMRILRY